MQRIVCDVGVVISGLLSADGPPGRVVDLWRDGAFDLIASRLWLAELDRVVARPKIARFIDAADAAELREAIVRQAVVVADPPSEPGLTPDPETTTSSASPAPPAPTESSPATAICWSSRIRAPPVLTPRAFLDALPPQRT